MKFLSDPFPLQEVSSTELQNLCQALWDWKICSSCIVGVGCSSRENCSWPRVSRLEKFFEFYKDATAAYVPESFSGNSPALRSHADLRDILRILRSEPDTPRIQLVQKYLDTRQSNSATILPNLGDQHKAFDLACRALTMVNAATNDEPWNVLELGTKPCTWHEQDSLHSFLASALPKGGRYSSEDIASFAPKITARRLQRVAGLKFCPTDDLRHHLRLDQDNGIVEIFHHTAFIKEQLRVPKAVIPRGIALEILDSIHNILFPSDAESQALLRSLASQLSLDPDCLQFESAPYRSDRQNSSGAYPYPYLSSRLAELHDEVLHPRPHGAFSQWLERKSGARYVMKATLIGVVIAVILGLLGLAVGVFQAWVAYQQWKHPISR